MLFDPSATLMVSVIYCAGFRNGECVDYLRVQQANREYLYQIGPLVKKDTSSARDLWTKRKMYVKRVQKEGYGYKNVCREFI
jgi:hypothetical protein